ncbi:hypothetical protein EPN28_01295 [Patescibacteria group bacterium]|nr:MAG: hypothetical protein EPN28_01295 [Patescibacteria group bacterium]
MQSTLFIYKHLCARLPPLFPTEHLESARAEIARLEREKNTGVEDVENSMIKFGYEAWPWNQAYREFLENAEAQVGEHFLLPHLSDEMREKFEDYRHYGMGLHDLHSGRSAEYFTSDERALLCEALVETQKQLRAYVDRDICGLSKKKYLARVKEFARILEQIKEKMDELRALADKEEEHPALAGEIRQRVRLFEHGLCLLGPDLDYDAVCGSIDFFHGRRQDLSRMRGINIPKQIDFYNQV